MQISTSTFIRFGAGKKEPIKLPKAVEKRLGEIAKKYNADVENAKQMYQNMKNLKFVKLTNEQIYQVIDNDLNPNGSRMSTAALGEEGGFSGGGTTEAIGEEGGDAFTTEAVGEEGGNTGGTTEAIGEEGGHSGGSSTEAIGEEGGFSGGGTTEAIGEEGGR